jgi:FeS assembly SUF system regulator
MIRMSKLADYSFILLAQMVSENKESWAASELAARTTLPLPTVAKLMKLLAKGGVVAAQRGATGGYRLMRPARRISIASIIESVDGPIALTDCVDQGEPNCAVSTLCPMHGGWDKVNKALRSALESVSLSDLAPCIAHGTAKTVSAAMTRT